MYTFHRSHPPLQRQIPLMPAPTATLLIYPAKTAYLINSVFARVGGRVKQAGMKIGLAVQFIHRV